MFLCGKLRRSKRKSSENFHVTHCLRPNESSDVYEASRLSRLNSNNSTQALVQQAAFESLARMRKRRKLSMRTMTSLTAVDGCEQEHESDSCAQDDKENSLPLGRHGNTNAERRSKRKHMSPLLTWLVEEQMIYEEITDNMVTSSSPVTCHTEHNWGTSKRRHLATCHQPISHVTDESHPLTTDGNQLVNNLPRLTEQRLNQGKLKLTISLPRPTQLMIQVEEAVFNRKLPPNQVLVVQTLLIPDESKKTLQEIQAKVSSRHHFEETVTYDMTGVHETKRLLICVTCSNNTDRQTLGSMSFGVKHLLAKGKKNPAPISDWYHLLPEHVGDRKHVVCRCEERASTLSKTGQSEMEGLKLDTRKALEKKLSKTEKYQLTVTKVPGFGFGFTIKGMMPVRVGRVKSGGAAEQAGLLDGDYIISINGTDTRSLSLAAVANLVRQASNCLQMEVARMVKDRCRFDDSQVTGSGRRPVQTTDETNSLVAASRITNWAVSLSEQVLNGSGNNPLSWQPELSVIPEESGATKRAASECTPGRSLWQPDLSQIRPVTGRSLDDVSRESNDNNNNNCNYNKRHVMGDRQDTVSSCQPDSYTDTDLTPADQSDLNTGLRRSRSWSDEDSPISYEMESALYNTEMSQTTVDSRSTEQDTTSVASLDEQQLSFAAERTAAIQHLLHIEEYFTRTMKQGTQRYSRPLRYQLLSRCQHVALFQNIEKLIMFSEFHICQLIKKNYSAEDSYNASTDGAVIDMVGSVYKDKIVMVCEAYQMYSRGINDALQLLDNLKQNENFNKFLERADIDNYNGLDVDQFLQQPLRHYQQLVTCLDHVLQTTKPQHPDYNNMKQVMEVICESVAILNSNTPSDGCHDGTSGHYTNVTSIRAQSCSTSTSSAVNMSRVDSEIADLQLKISFAKHIKPFVIATSHRHVILSGQLSRISGKSVRPFWAVLCNDVLLLAEKQVKGQLKVTEAPIFLEQILQADFDCVHPAEFHITCHTAPRVGSQSDWTICEYKFRTTNMEDKYAWKAVLEQRIKYRKSRTDSAYASMEEIL